MSKNESKNILVEGQVLEALPNTMFKIKLNDGREILVTLKGKVRRSSARIMPGDRVRVEMTPYDQHRGRIQAKI